MGKNNAKSGIGFWLLIWLLGLAGQLCWNMENQWFNTFVYAKIAKDPTIISWMLAISAAATTVSTFLFGCVSDRKGNRKTLVSVGYILWGIFTIIFGTTEFMNKGSDSALMLTRVLYGIQILWQECCLLALDIFSFYRPSQYGQSVFTLRIQEDSLRGSGLSFTC